MRTRLLCQLTAIFTIFLSCGAALAASGPQTTWNVFTLPNPQITPDWRAYAPPDCQANPDACGQDHRFWEEWDFSLFQAAIDDSFDAVGATGQYQGVMMILPLGDTDTYWSNISLMYTSALRHGVQLQIVVFPKWKFGSEYCYLYSSGAPSGCPLVPGTTTAVAYQELLKLMEYVQDLSNGCYDNGFNFPFAVWYGWSSFSPGYGALKNFWESLPTMDVISGCNLRASYITWLDTGFSGVSEVKRLQRYVTTHLNQPYWVNTELYSTAQIQQYATTYAPWQTVITGYSGAADITTWAQGMCSKWSTASQPTRLGVWTFYDRDLGSMEHYRSYIDGDMAQISSICAY